MASRAAKLENDLGRDPIPQMVLRIAIPSMLAQFVRSEERRVGKECRR